MKLNHGRIIQAAKRGIAVKPTNIILMRDIEINNGMRGEKKVPTEMGQLDVFIDDTHRLTYFFAGDGGHTDRIRKITMIAVSETFEIKKDDYFYLGTMKYKIAYPGAIIPGVYEADLEVVENG